MSESQSEVEPPLRGDDAGVQPEAELWARAARPLPTELWLHIMRAIDDLGTYNAVARTCQLFAALAREEKSAAQDRLARPAIWRENNYALWTGHRLARDLWHGEVHITDPSSGELGGVRHYRAGELEGEAIDYYGFNFSKRVKFVNYRAGKVEGHVNEYDADTGQLLRSRSYEDGKCQGPYVEYDNQYLRLFYYEEDDVEEGPHIEWVRGKAFAVMYLQAGRLEGYCHHYSDGELCYTFLAEDGLIYGMRGNLLGRERSEWLGNKEGWTRGYYNDGSLLYACYFEDGKGYDTIRWDEHGVPTVYPSEEPR